MKSSYRLCPVLMYVLLTMTCREAVLAFGVETPDAAAGSQSLPFKLYGGYLIVVDGQIGRLEHLKFALDTGASSSIIDRKIARKVALARQPGHTSQFGKPVSNQWILVPNLRFGPIAAANQYLPTADLSIQRLPTHVDVVIWVVFLNLSSFSIDNVSGQIFFGSTGGFVQPAKMATVEILVQGRPFRVVVDTGAKELILYQDRVAGRIPNLTLVSELTWSTIGSTVYARRVKLPGIFLGGIELDQNCLLLEEPSSASPVDGYLGVAALRAKRVEFDLQNGAFRWAR